MPTNPRPWQENAHNQAAGHASQVNGNVYAGSQPSTTGDVERIYNEQHVQNLTINLIIRIVIHTSPFPPYRQTVSHVPHFVLATGSPTPSDATSRPSTDEDPSSDSDEELENRPEHFKLKDLESRHGEAEDLVDISWASLDACPRRMLTIILIFAPVLATAIAGWVVLC